MQKQCACWLLRLHAHHRRPEAGLEEDATVSRNLPVAAAVLAALVPAKESGDALGPEIRDAKLAVAREDDGVGEDSVPVELALALDDAPLQVAEHVAPSGAVVGEVAQGLHQAGPGGPFGSGCHSAVGVELLEVLNEWLEEVPLPGIL